MRHKSLFQADAARKANLGAKTCREMADDDPAAFEQERRRAAQVSLLLRLQCTTTATSTIERDKQ